MSRSLYGDGNYVNHTDEDEDEDGARQKSTPVLPNLVEGIRDSNHQGKYEGRGRATMLEKTRNSITLSTTSRKEARSSLHARNLPHPLIT